MRQDLSALGEDSGPQWYMVEAVQAHELTHVSEYENSYNAQFGTLKSTIRSLTAPCQCGDTPATGANKIKSLPAYAQAINTAINNATANYNAIPDPNQNTDAAEHSVVDPVVAAIQNKATSNKWPTCK